MNTLKYERERKANKRLQESSLISITYEYIFLGSPTGIDLKTRRISSLHDIDASNKCLGSSQNCS